MTKNRKCRCAKIIAALDLKLSVFVLTLVMNVYGKLQVAKYYNFGTLNFWSRDLTDYNQEDALFDVLE